MDIKTARDYVPVYFNAGKLRSAPTPCVFYSEKRLEENARCFTGLGKSLGIDLDVYYALKACYFPAILRVLARNGLGADCQSAMEMDIARSAGFRSRRIVYNSPAKPPSSVTAALKDGSLVVLDSEEECRRELTAAAPGARFGLRVNAAAGGRGEFIGTSDRFGVAPEKAGELLALFTDKGGSRLRMLHCHCLSHCSNPADAARILSPLVLWYRSVRRKCPEAVLNLGGGFESRLFFPENGPGLAEVIKAEITPLSGLRRGTAFAIEPGRAMVGDAAVAVSSVVAAKRGPDGRDWLMLDIGTNLLIPTRSALFTVLPLDGSAHGGETAEVSVGDGTCSPAGVIQPDARLPRLKPGDRVLVLGTGAYTYSLCETFHSPVPPCYLLKKDGSTETLLSETMARKLLHILYPPPRPAGIKALTAAVKDK